jgi:L-serine dehydratase
MSWRQEEDKELYSYPLFYQKNDRADSPFVIDTFLRAIFSSKTHGTMRLMAPYLRCKNRRFWLQWAMASKRLVSAFDIIGPIMVGPSSSHTAGAARLGKLARGILGCQPEHAILGLHGSFAHTGKGHGTDRALVAGLLGLSTHDARLRDSLALARAWGMTVTFRTVDLGEEAHPNSAELILQAAGQKVQIVGASTGGGMVAIQRINQYDIRFTGEHETLLVVAKDRPGTVHAITGLFLQYHLNIAFSRVERQQRGGEAIQLFETDDNIPPGLVATLETFDWVHWARHIPHLGE